MKRTKFHQIRSKFPETSSLFINGLFFVFAALEWLASGYFYFARNCLTFRFFIQFGALIFAVIGMWGLFSEYRDRQDERLARMWGIAISDASGNSGKVPALEFLIARGQPLTGIKLVTAWLQGGNFEYALLDHADLSDTDLKKTKLIRAILTSTAFDGAKLLDTDLRRAQLDHSTFRSARIFDSNFSEVVAYSADFSGAKIVAQFENANLTAAKFNDATIMRTSFKNACLERVSFKGASFPQAFANDKFLLGADISGADISGADFTGVRGLSQAMLDSAHCAYETPILPNDRLKWPESKICTRSSQASKSRPCAPLDTSHVLDGASPK